MAKVESSSKQRRWSLYGMTALVTGGTKGIGYAIVEELAGLGATVHICSRNELEIKECLRNWESKGFKVTGSVCDVSIRSDREKLMETVSSIVDSKLNILINNAATHVSKPTADFTAEDMSTQMATNFESVFHLSQLAHPLLKASAMGSIVFLSSIAGVVAHYNLSIYGATKERGQQRIFGRIVCSNSDATSWGTRGGGITGSIPLPPLCFIPYWSGYLCRRWMDSEWVISYS